MKNDLRLAYTVREASRILDVTEENLAVMLRERVIPSQHCDGRVLIHRSAIERHIEAELNAGRRCEP